MLSTKRVTKLEAEMAHLKSNLFCEPASQLQLNNLLLIWTKGQISKIFNIFQHFSQIKFFCALIL